MKRRSKCAAGFSEREARIRTIVPIPGAGRGFAMARLTVMKSKSVEVIGLN
jgi:hypothetical protein